ncbi:MAG: hypothetical protein M2R45_04486 [Verrucomicrobia subdivision 3 bacterium]|nr:hypothetical protein [Limisphaerales bacterium]MCS1412670.1 hypothetical protein [Limisphaerales bacterium]
MRFLAPPTETEFPLAGSIDDVVIWNRSLSGVEIASICKDGSEGNSTTDADAKGKAALLRRFPLVWDSNPYHHVAIFCHSKGRLGRCSNAVVVKKTTQRNIRNQPEGLIFQCEASWESFFVCLD